jgi:2-iminobutanoate/2-iminopropanoate deaminase
LKGTAKNFLARRWISAVYTDAIALGETHMGGDEGGIELASRKFPFSPALRVGDVVYVSGHLGIDLATGTGPEDVEEEVRTMMDGVRATLAGAGLKMDDLVSVDVFATDLALFGRFNTVYLEYFSEPYPARAFLGGSKLLFDRRFEVRGIAVVDGAAKKRRV